MVEAQTEKLWVYILPGSFNFTKIILNKSRFIPFESSYLSDMISFLGASTGMSFSCFWRAMPEWAIAEETDAIPCDVDCSEDIEKGFI